MIASKAGVPNGLMNAIRRATSSIMATTRSCRPGRRGPGRSGTERRQVHDRLARRSTMSAMRRPVVGPAPFPNTWPAATYASSKPGSRSMIGRLSVVNGSTPAQARANGADAQRRHDGRQALGDERDAGEVGLPHEARVVHRAAEQVRPVGPLADRLEEDLAVAVLGLVRPVLGAERRQLAEDRVLLDRGRPVQDRAEHPRHRRGLDDLQSHRVDRDLGADLPEQLRRPRPGRDDHLARRERLVVRHDPRDARALALERSDGRVFDDPRPVPLRPRWRTPGRSGAIPSGRRAGRTTRR